MKSQKHVDQEALDGSPEFNSFLSSGNFFRLLIAFANSLDQIRIPNLSLLTHLNAIVWETIYRGYSTFWNDYDIYFIQKWKLYTSWAATHFFSSWDEYIINHDIIFMMTRAAMFMEFGKRLHEFH